MNHDVFISYSTSDQKIVEALSHYLEERGIRCFVAYRDISKGVVWAAAITEAIEKCRMMIVIFSKEFNSSIQVDREIELCSEEKKPILTFRVQDSAFTGAKKYYLKNLNWIDAFPEPYDYFEHLFLSITSLIQVNKPVSGYNSEISFSVANELFVNYLNSGSISELQKSFEIFLQSSEKGDTQSQFSVGMLLLTGLIEGKKYNPNSIGYFKKAGENGNADACLILALLYASNVYQGDKDHIEAKKWYDKCKNITNESFELYGTEARGALENTLNAFYSFPEIEVKDNVINITIKFEGRFVLIDNKLKIYIDDELIGSGNFRNGFNYNITTSLGKHSMQISGLLINDYLQFEINENGSYYITLKYRTFPTAEFLINSIDKIK